MCAALYADKISEKTTRQRGREAKNENAVGEREIGRGDRKVDSNCLKKNRSEAKKKSRAK